MRTRRESDRRGIALVIALFALVVIGALVAAVFFAAQLEVRSGTNVVSGLQADQAAQAGLEYAAANWRRTWAKQGTGNSIGVNWIQLGSTNGYFTDSVTQLNDQLVLVRSFGQARNGVGAVLGSRTGGMLFKVSPPDFGISAAATVSGNAWTFSPGTIRGTDSIPGGGAWSSACASLALVDRTGVRASGTTTNLGATIAGSPGGISNADASVTTTVAKVEGLFGTLRGMADLSLGSVPGTVQPVLTGGHACASGSGQPGNWGDPTYAPSGVWSGTHPCASYFPIIYLSSGGTNDLSGAVGQGILIAEGNVAFGAGSQFYGPVITRGWVTMQSGARVYGAIIAEQGFAAWNGFEADYSSCAVTLASAAAQIGRPIAARRYISF